MTVDDAIESAAGNRSRAAELLRQHRRASSPDSAAALRRLLLAELASAQAPLAGDSLPPIVQGAASRVGYFLARRELLARARRAESADRTPREWRCWSTESVSLLRELLEKLGILATAASIEQPGGEPAPVHLAPMLQPFGRLRRNLILTRRLVADLSGIFGIGERAVLCDIVERLGRDRTDAALAIAVGGRIFATDWASRTDGERLAFRHAAAPNTFAILTAFEPLPVQSSSVRSLLALAACRAPASA